MGKGCLIIFVLLIMRLELISFLYLELDGLSVLKSIMSMIITLKSLKDQVLSGTFGP